MSARPLRNGVLQLLRPEAIMFFFVLGIFSFSSCKKDETIHEDLIVDGNQAPPVDGVSSVTLNTYINKLYIDLIGRAPTVDELEEKSSFIKSSHYYVASRETVIGDLMSTYEYYKNINVLMGQKMLIDADSLTIAGEIYLYQLFVDQAILVGDSLSMYYLQYELDKLTNLQNAGVDLFHHAIGINEYYRRYIFNEIYDNVNMGSENFVISCFENLFSRYPTDDEKFDGVNMVDGVSSQLFLIDGSSKEDFIDIVTNCLEFYQGLVTEIFNTYLARDPDSEEMIDYALQIESENNYNSAKTDILKSTEYAGF